MRKYSLLLLFILSFSLVTTVQAQETNTTTNSSDTSTRSAEKSALMEEAKRKSLEAREAYKARLESAKEEYKKRIEEMRLKQAQLKEEAKTRFEAIRDEKKRSVVERIDTNMSERNARWSEHWNKVLERLSQILDKIEERVQSARDDGRDVNAAVEAVARARTAVEAARAKVNEQAGKTYNIQVTSEASLGTSVSGVVIQFKNDVHEVVNSLNEARKAISEALSLLKGVKGVTNSQ